MAQFTSAGGGGVPVSASLVGATNPSITRVTITSASTEQSHALPADTKGFTVTTFQDPLQLSFTSGDSGTTFVTIPRWCYRSWDDLSATGITLYFQSPNAGQTIQIESWA